MKKILFIIASLLLFSAAIKAQANTTAAQEKYREAMEQAHTSKQYLTYGLIILVSAGLLRIVAYFYMKNKKNQ